MFRHSDYDSLEKVYSVWVVLEPKKELRGVIETGTRTWKARFQDREDDTGAPSMTNIIILNMGCGKAENPLRVMDLLETILRREDKENIREDVRKNFNIVLDDKYIREVVSTGEIADGFYR